MEITLLKGKTRQQIYALLGEDYYPVYEGDSRIYIVSRIWFEQKKAFMIDFDSSGLACHAEERTIELI